MGFIYKELLVYISPPCGQSFAMAFAVENLQNLQYSYATAPLMIVK